MTSTPPATLAADAVDVAGRLRMTAFRLTRLLRQQDTEGLAPTLSAALATIDRDGPLTLGELAAREHVAPPSITKAVEKLVAAGLVTRAPDDDRPAGGARPGDTRPVAAAWPRTGPVAPRGWRRGSRDLSPADLAKLDAAADVLERLIHQSDGGHE